MQFQLTSAFSTKVTWVPIDGVKTYTVQWKQNETVKETKIDGEELVLLNLEPSTQYGVRVYNEHAVTVTGWLLQCSGDLRCA